MSNSYALCTAGEALKCSRKEYRALAAALNREAEDHYHGFRCESGDDGKFYFYAEEGGNPDELPADFRLLLGALLAKNKKPYVSIGVAFTCDRFTPGSHGGQECRIYPDGLLIWPKVTWPADEAPAGLKFMCPDCRCERQLEEVVSVDTVLNPMTRLDPQGDHDYGPQRSEGDSEVLEYQCENCGWTAPDDSIEGTSIRDCVSLAKWLKKQPYNKTKKQRTARK